MCGILGFFRPRGVPTDNIAFENGLDRLKRRGPDSSGQWRDPQVWLGHRRLAIIDLSSAGAQPMLSPDGRYVIVFNGEIYNHLEVRRALGESIPWRGTSDTETLLAAYATWGPSCLQRLNGMFAIAIWDTKAKQMFLARDRLGVKPLYYSWIHGQLAFGSRPAAVATLLQPEDRKYSLTGLNSYLELGFIPAPQSMYQAMHKLEPGHYLLCDGRDCVKHRYWSFANIVPDPLARPEMELIDELQELIRQAVHARMISDVPLGAFLSSGVDSAVVVAAMRDTGNSAINCYSISFTDPRFDEGPGATRIANYLGVNLVTERLGVDELLKLLPDYIREADEPLADSSSIATMAVARLARRDVTVALTGDGGDELFCGYPHYQRFERISRAQALPSAARRALAVGVGTLPRHNAKLLAGALTCNDDVTLFHFLRSMSKDFPSLLDDDVAIGGASSAEEFARTAARFPAGLSSEEFAMRLDQSYTLPDLYLQKVDLATMAFSLEGRCPLTDYRLVEWALRLPIDFKRRDNTTKYLLKRVLARSLPPHFVYQPKRGFNVPIGPWLRGPLKEWALERLNDRFVADKLPLKMPLIRELFELQSSGRRESYPLLWAVLMLMGFIAEHSDLGPAPRLHTVAVREGEISAL